MAMKRHLRKIIVALAILVVTGASAGFYIKSRNGKKEQLEYQTEKVDRGEIKITVSATGVIQPKTLVDVKSNAGGEVTDIAVDVGSRVRPSEYIASIDPTDARAQLDQALADQAGVDARIAQ